MRKAYKNMHGFAHRQAGFSLFEILITMVVSAVGLMSLAALQAAGVKTNQSAYHGSQAAVLAYDIADKMRANTASIDNYLTSYMTLAQATAAGVQTGCKTTSGCTSAELAQNDLLEWAAALNASLPGPTGTITLDGAVYTVTVNWDDNRDGVTDADDVPFQVSFQP